MSHEPLPLTNKYFEILFKRDYKPEDALALHAWMQEINDVWKSDNPLSFNETLLAMKAYAPNAHLYAVSQCFAILNNMADRVPSPSKSLESAKQNGLLSEVVRLPDWV